MPERTTLIVYTVVGVLLLAVGQLFPEGLGGLATVLGLLLLTVAAAVLVYARIRER